MFQQPKEVPENFADDHDAEVNAGLKHGRLLGDLFAVMTDNKLKPVVLPQGKGAILCGYVYGFADVLCQDLGNERDGAASVSALVAALKVVAPLSSKTLIDRFLMGGESPLEFEQGMLEGATAANAWLKNEAWPASLREIVTILVKPA